MDPENEMKFKGFQTLMTENKSQFWSGALVLAWN